MARGSPGADDAPLTTGRCCFSVQVGVSQSSEIVTHGDVVLAGALPAPFDHRTRYVAAKGVDAGPGADAFLAFLQGASGRAALAAIGFVEP